DGAKDIPHAPQQFILAVTAGAGTDEGPDPQRGILAPFTNKRPELGPRLFFRVFEEDPGCLAESLRNGPERDAVPIRQAPAPQHLRASAHVADEFLNQPGLAHTGLAKHGHDLAMRVV